MKKSFLFFFLMTLFVIPVFAGTNSKTFFPSLKAVASLPIDSEYGQSVGSEESEQHKLVYEALGQSYSYEWSEKYLHPDFKKNLNVIYSESLSELLPSSQIMMFKSRNSNDLTSSITVRLIDRDCVVVLAVKDSKIVAIQIK